MLRAILGVCVVCSVACGNVTASAEASADLAGHTVAVRATDGWCSGAFVGPGLVLTAEHCAGPETRVCDSRNRCAVAHRVQVAERDDLAWYSTDLAGPSARLASSTRWGETLTVVHHVGSPWSAQRGQVIALHGGWDALELDFRAPRGMSGSPAFRADGSIACIVTGAYTGAQAGTWCQAVAQ